MEYFQESGAPRAEAGYTFPHPEAGGDVGHNMDVGLEEVKEPCQATWEILFIQRLALVLETWYMIDWFP